MFSDMSVTIQGSIIAAVVMNLLLCYLMTRAKNLKDVLIAQSIWWSVAFVIVFWLWKTYEVVNG